MAEFVYSSNTSYYKINTSVENDITLNFKSKTPDFGGGGLQFFYLSKANGLIQEISGAESKITQSLATCDGSIPNQRGKSFSFNISGTKEIYMQIVGAITPPNFEFEIFFNIQPVPVANFVQEVSL